jgi:hypothetical protein
VFLGEGLTLTGNTGQNGIELLRCWIIDRFGIELLPAFNNRKL